MDSYDVRFWDIKKLGSGTGARHRVRWAVDGREHCKSFKARPLADGFLDGLKYAVRDRRPFNPRTGLPEADTTGDELVTWYAHARSYAEAKWPNLAPVSRRSVAEALVTVTVALTAKEPGAPDAKVLRHGRDVGSRRRVRTGSWPLWAQRAAASPTGCPSLLVPALLPVVSEVPVRCASPRLRGGDGRSCSFPRWSSGRRCGGQGRCRG